MLNKMYKSQETLIPTRLVIIRQPNITTSSGVISLYLMLKAQFHCCGFLAKYNSSRKQLQHCVPFYDFSVFLSRTVRQYPRTVPVAQSYCFKFGHLTISCSVILE